MTYCKCGSKDCKYSQSFNKNGSEKPRRDPRDFHCHEPEKPDNRCHEHDLTVKNLTVKKSSEFKGPATFKDTVEICGPTTINNDLIVKNKIVERPSFPKRCAGLPAVSSDNGAFPTLPTFAPSVSENWKGLMSGDVTFDSAIVNVGNPSLAPEDARLVWYCKNCNGVWTQQPDQFASPASKEIPWYRFQLTDLLPNNEYSFYVTTPNFSNRSVLGRFKTAPNTTAPPKCFRFAVSSCCGFRDFFNNDQLVFTNTDNAARMPDEDLDFQVTLGDYPYAEDSNLQTAEGDPDYNPFPGRPNFRFESFVITNDAPFSTRPNLTVAEYVTAYQRQLFNSPNIIEQLRATSTFFIADDHEYFNNFPFRGMSIVLTDDEFTLFLAGLGIGENSPFLVPPPPGFTQNDAMFLWAPPNIPRSIFTAGDLVRDTATITIKDTPPKRYFKRSWGTMADLFFLDVNQDRGPSSTQYISNEQMNWIKSELLSSKAPFKFIFAAKPWTVDPQSIEEDFVDFSLSYYEFINSVEGFNFPQTTVERVAGQDFLTFRGDGSGLFREQNPNNIPTIPPLPPQRDEFLNFIADTPINGVFLVGGDFHYGNVEFPEDSLGEFLNPVTPAGRLWQITCSPTGSPYNNFARNNITNSSNNALFFDAGDQNHTIFEPDPVNHLLTLRFVRNSTSTPIERKVVFELDENYNPATIGGKSCDKMASELSLNKKDTKLWAGKPHTEIVAEMLKHSMKKRLSSHEKLSCHLDCQPDRITKGVQKFINKHESLLSAQLELINDKSVDNYVKNMCPRVRKFVQNIHEGNATLHE